MKSLYKSLFLLLPMLALAMTGCSNDEPFSVASSEDDPHILDPTFPDRTNGELPVVASFDRDASFKMNLTVTPSHSTEVVWYIDGEEVATGTSIDMPMLAGTYNMKVVATTTAGKSTYREGIIEVKPLDADPWATQISFERIVAPSSVAKIYGDNLWIVKSLRIGNTSIDKVSAGEDGSLTYTVPAGINNGTQRLVLIDADGNEYGGNTITVSDSPLVTSGADRTTAGGDCILTGINLNSVSTIVLGDSNLEIVSKSDSEIVVKCPVLDDGDYVLKGTCTQGNVQFFIGGAIVDEATVVVSSQQTLWAGHHYVSWDLDDSDPHKTFNLLGQDVFASIKPGSILSIYYSIEPSAEYHQLRTVSCWWTDLPGTGTVEFSEDGVVEVTLTADALAMIQEQGGFLCVGHGYYVDLVTLR